MARIYLLPTQVAWNSTTVIISFYATALMLGGAAIMCLMVLDLKFAEIQNGADVELRSQLIRYSAGGLTVLTATLVLLSMGITYIQIRILGQGDLIARTSLSLLLDLYLPLFLMRFLFLIYGSFSLVYVVVRMYRSKSTLLGLMTPVYLSCLLILSERLSDASCFMPHISVWDCRNRW